MATVNQLAKALRYAVETKAIRRRQAEAVLSALWDAKENTHPDGVEGPGVRAAERACIALEAAYEALEFALYPARNADRCAPPVEAPEIPGNF